MFSESAVRVVVASTVYSPATWLPMGAPVGGGSKGGVDD